MTGDPHLAAGIYARHWEGGGTAAAALGEEGQWGKPEEEDEEASDLHSRGLRFFLFNLKRREKEEKKNKKKRPKSTLEFSSLWLADVYAITHISRFFFFLVSTDNNKPDLSCKMCCSLSLLLLFFTPAQTKAH